MQNPLVEIGFGPDFQTGPQRRAKCEDIEMETRYLTARQRCVEFAKQKCVPAFKNDRIEVSCSDLGVVGLKEAFTLISMACFMNNRSKEIWSWGLVIFGVRELVEKNADDIEMGMRLKKFHAFRELVIWIRTHNVKQ